MKVDVRWVLTFVCVARHGQLGAAADELHLSASALSMQLHKLQAQLGTVLLRRTGRGLELTDEGEAFLVEARVLAEAVQRLNNRAVAEGPFATPSRKRPMSIGTILDPHVLRLGEFIRTLRQACPHIQPDLRHGISGSVLKGVAQGHLDVGFYLGDLPSPALLSLQLASVRYVVIAPRGWSARLRGRAWGELASLPWIDTPKESAHHRTLHPRFRRERTVMNAVARVDQESSMLDLVREGVGLSLARESEALRAAHEHGLSVSRDHALDLALNLVAQPSRGTDPEVQALFSAAAHVWSVPWAFNAPAQETT